VKAQITIHDIQVMAHIGVPPAERAIPQQLNITISFQLPTITSAVKSDDIRHTIDYAQVRESIINTTQAKERRLIETLAADLIDTLKKRHSLEQIVLRIEKFPLPDTRSVVLTVQG
jgi:dihydroneopterin aldolase